MSLQRAESGEDTIEFEMLAMIFWNNFAHKIIGFYLG